MKYLPLALIIFLVSCDGGSAPVETSQANESLSDAQPQLVGTYVFSQYDGLGISALNSRRCVSDCTIKMFPFIRVYQLDRDILVQDESDKVLMKGVVREDGTFDYKLVIDPYGAIIPAKRDDEDSLMTCVANSKKCGITSTCAFDNHDFLCTLIYNKQ